MYRPSQFRSELRCKGCFVSEARMESRLRPRAHNGELRPVNIVTMMLFFLISLMIYFEEDEVDEL